MNEYQNYDKLYEFKNIGSSEREMEHVCTTIKELETKI
jgi:hypothetical protein